MPELYTLKGYNRVANKWRKLASKYREEIDQVFDKFAERQVRRLRSKPYPPERPAQKYVRTYELRRSWRAVRHWPSDWAVVNEKPSAHWVVSEAMQAWMHRDRWYTVPGVIEEELPVLRQDVIEALMALVGG